MVNSPFFPGVGGIQIWMNDLLNSLVWWSLRFDLLVWFYPIWLLIQILEPPPTSLEPELWWIASPGAKPAVGQTL